MAAQTALVTGANGFVGATSCARWSRAAPMCARLFVRVPIPARSTVSIAKFAIGDVRDLASVERAVRGCDEVYHVAADYRLWVVDEAPMYAANVEGTRNVLDAARRAKVAKIVHTSTVGALGIGADKVGREDTPVTLDDMVGPYKRSKFLAEQVALEAAREGLPVVIVNPSTPVGTLDYKPTPTGRIIVDFLNRRMPAFMSRPDSISRALRTSRGAICWRLNEGALAKNIFSAARI